MPKTSESQPVEKQAAAGAKTTVQKAVQPKAVMDILLVLDWNSLKADGIERSLGGLHRLIAVEKSRLHLIHVDKADKQAEATEPEAMLSGVEATLRKFHWELAESRVLTLTHEMTTNLVEEIRLANYDMVVLCSPELPPGSQSRFAHFVNHVTSQVPTSVLVWRKPLSEQPHALKVLFGVDGSESSLVAIGKASELLHLKYVNLELVTVLSPIFQDNAVTAPFVNPDVLDQALEANAQMIFEMSTGLLETQNLPKPRCKKLIGSPATELGYYAELETPDLIVVGSHNRKGLMAWLMGSVSSQMLQWDQHNLLVVR